MKYLFQAVFTDGHTITQTQADRSTLIPPDENGNGPSAFYDVLNYPGELQWFVLTPENEPHVIQAAVYLTTGELVLNGNSQLNQGWADFKKELVYWRVMNANHGIAPTVSEYIIGWKANIDGQELQHVIRVSE